MYDYYLGGKDDLAADREAAEEFLTAIRANPSTLLEVSWASDASSATANARVRGGVRYGATISRHQPQHAGRRVADLVARRGHRRLRNPVLPGR
ncbi:MAG: hypothetical protein ACRDN9_07550 [Streptosporangiaceae bacterium]